MATMDLNTVVDIESGDGVVRVSIGGNVTAESDFSALTSLDASRVMVDVGRLNRFNSRGVLIWMQMLEGLCQRANVEIWNAGHAFMQQYAMIRRFVGNASIESVRARVLCEHCGQTAEVTLERTRDYPKGRAGLSAFPTCKTCKTVMVADDEVFELDLTPDLRRV